MPSTRRNAGFEPDILVIEDTPTLRLIYEQYLASMGLTVATAETAAAGMQIFAEYAPPVVILDLLLPDRDGLEMLRDMLRMRPGAAIIVVTADRSVDRAVTAMRSGAQDFLVKPVAETRLASVVQNARRAVAMAQPDHHGPQAGALAGFIGTSAKMTRVYDMIRSTARSMAPVFITGESGTGKELCAEAIHALSPRAAEKFVVLDGSSLSTDRFDSEVFGHLRGAVSGATADMPGALQRADGGTLFLDKIDELDLGLQAKLLRFLHSTSFRPLGATEPRKADIRLITSTTRPAHAAIEGGHLRNDLFYRLCVVPIQMPPLRERPEDIGPIAETLLRKFAAIENRAFTRISPQAHAILQAQDWPGNIRQLTNVLRSITVLHDAPELVSAMLPSDLSVLASPGRGPQSAPTGNPSFAGQTLAQIERAVIEDALHRHDGSVSQTARELDLAPSTLYRKIDHWKKTDVP
ncbi:sigma-54-dependent Fis family transcriptional regulator [Thioclava sp. SK-1]|nr:sigma-54-dependent Fis family transcriptional regulator [Thioclava sp. SK-1]